jgi:hypothetical protein
MSRTMKWILGIVIVLALLVVVAGIGFLAFNRLNVFGLMPGTRQVQPFGYGRMMPWRNMPMNPYFGMPGRGYSGFFPLRFILGWVFCLGILALIVLGIIALFTGLRRNPQPTGAPIQAVPPAPVATPAPAEPASAEAVIRNCPSCGRQVNEDWSHCPYCGSPLS